MPNSNSTLEEIFRQNNEKEWIFVKPGGNFGDHLIYSGAEALARRVGIKWIDRDYLNFDPSAFSRSSAIYLHGGGGFNPWGSRRAFTMLSKALHANVDLVVQGPQTADTVSEATVSLFQEAFVQVNSAEVHVFARENTTRDYFSGILPNGTSIHLDHDTAFHLNKQDISGLAELRRIPSGRYNLLVAREDDEAPPKAPFAGRTFVTLDPAYFATNFRHWLRIHAYAKAVFSNRLHSAIASAIMGKPVVVMAGKYHKNKSIWMYSLKDKGVEWIDGESINKDNTIMKNRETSWLNNSWKLRRAKMWLKGIPLS